MPKLDDMARHWRYGVDAYEHPRGVGHRMTQLLRVEGEPPSELERVMLAGYRARAASAAPINPYQKETMTTLDTLTENQVVALRSEALAAGDVAMAVICDVASSGPETIGDSLFGGLPSDVRVELQSLTQDAARTKVVKAINHSEAQD